ncbi:nicotinamide-nucleotide amidase [Allopseudospirillum japonicum]|uniref:Nicotinamide-nucleotide amidase n=1 Tax=Allopseudospirillum japonicum TaxID=64971 RepID=A0A1H6TCJ1_9GAMM|nr:nicotinamide-nucleotide amidohydrolase family protein [Allopseudospirillum japonicum]SEI77813.1 nicotinamide-nucleotide amidase [Allopseudospirillum japonicum]
MSYFQYTQQSFACALDVHLSTQDFQRPIADALIYDTAYQVITQACAHYLHLTCAESCTGGWVAQSLTAIAGSSACLDLTWVTYANRAKHQALNVPQVYLDQLGAVSAPVVETMVQGALQHAQADLGVAISGVAGPGGGSANKPVGTVDFAWGTNPYALVSRRLHFVGDRDQIRRCAVLCALQGLKLWLQQPLNT